MRKRPSPSEHRKTWKLLLLYIDGDLPSGRRKKVEDHLRRCTACSKAHDALHRTWRKEAPRMRTSGWEPPPGAWMALEARLESPSRAPSLASRLMTTARRAAAPAAITGLFLLALAGGIFLGTAPTARSLGDASRPDTSTSVAAELGLDRFSVFPPGALTALIEEAEHGRPAARRETP